MIVTWGQLHVGDEVRGADQRVWTVVDVEPGANWVVGGKHGRFRLALGDREVQTERLLAEPAPIVTRADHTDAAAAAQALLNAGMNFEIVKEERMELSQPAQEPEHDQWGRYKLPDPVTGEIKSWTRATTMARTLADEYHLTQWKLRKTAKGIAIRPDLIAGAAAADPDEDKSTLNGIAKQAMDAAEASAGANFGTALHSFAQRLDGGESFDSLRAPAPLDADLKAYLELLRVNRLKIVHMERIVVVPELGVAGRLDRIVEQPPGQTKASRLSILDLKSAKSVDWSWLEIAIQQTIYSRARYMYDLATKTYEPMPEVDQDRGLIVHAPIGRAHPQLWAFPMMKAWVQLAVEVRQARSEAKRKDFAWLVQPVTEDLLVHRVRKAQDQVELAKLWDQHHPRGEWTEEVNAAAAAAWEDIQREIEDQINEATFD